MAKQLDARCPGLEPSAPRWYGQSQHLRPSLVFRSVRQSLAALPEFARLERWNEKEQVECAASRVPSVEHAEAARLKYVVDSKREVVSALDFAIIAPKAGQPILHNQHLVAGQERSPEVGRTLKDRPRTTRVFPSETLLEDRVACWPQNRKRSAGKSSCLSRKGDVAKWRGDPNGTEMEPRIIANFFEQ